MRCATNHQHGARFMAKAAKRVTSWRHGGGGASHVAASAWRSSSLYRAINAQ